MLDFSNLGLIFLPRDIEYLSSLVELILRDNQLKELPPQIGMTAHPLFFFIVLIFLFQDAFLV